MERIMNLLNGAQSLASTSGRSSGDLTWEKVVASSLRAVPEQINDSVFEVYAPEERRPSVEIVFFHGLQVEGSNKSQLTTWLSRDQSELWLYWMLEKIPNARILTISYDGHARRTCGEGLMDMYRIRENLVINLIDAEVGQDGCPVVLVGHCVGGLVMKEVCVQANSILGFGESHKSNVGVQNFLHNLKALFFFASPHHGTRLADESIGFSKSPLFEDVTTNNSKAERQNEDFRKLHNKYMWKTFGMVEGRKSHLVNPYLGTFTGFIVADASARHDVDDFYTDTTADHFEVCRPHSKKSSSFKILSNFVAQVVKEDKARHGHKIGFPDDDEVVGLKDQVNLVMKKLKESHHLGIVGMAGIGKTTLAKTVYNKISERFEYTCFIQEVKKLFAHEKNPVNLRVIIVRHLYQNGRKVAEDFEWSTLKKKSVLIVLDDAENESQVRVMTESDGFLDESRVIVTARDRRFLISKQCMFECHSAVQLDDKASKRLFCLNAFGTADAPGDFENSLQRVLEKCANLPLALKITGKYLCTRPKRLWDAAVEKLSRAEPLGGALDDGLWSILTVSYDSLAKPEQEMFKDVSMFFHGERLEKAKKIWGVCGWKGIEGSWENLLDKGLVTQLTQVPQYEDSEYGEWCFDYFKDLEEYQRKTDKMALLEPLDEDVRDYVIGMHEVLRDLGRTKAGPEPYIVSDGSRVCDDVLNEASQSNQGNPKVEVLKISFEDWNIRRLHRLHHLRILSLEGQSRGSLVVSMGRLYGAFDLLPCRLKYLKVVGIESWIDSSVDSEQQQTLQYLEIEDCWVKKLPSSLEQLHALKHLTISRCDSLGVLPSLQRLQALEHLTVECCWSLGDLPASLGKLGALKYLKIHKCPNLEGLPHSVGQLRALQRLEITDCKNLVLSHTLGRVQNLEHLVIKGFRPPGILGAVIGQLKALKDLDVEFRNDFGHPTVKIFGQLEFLKMCINAGTRIREDDIWEAFLDIVGELKALRELRVNGGDQWLRAILDTHGCLQSLEVLELENWRYLTSPKTLGHLQALKLLTIQSWTLESLPDSLGQLQALKHLHIVASRLEALAKTLGNLQALEHLQLCTSSMEALPDSLEDLQALKRLELHCEGLGSIPKRLGRLKALERLSIRGCRQRTLPETLVELQALEELEIVLGRELRGLPDTVAQLRALKRLILRIA